MVLHVGLPKTGTTYLQRLLAGNRDRLRDGGVLYPLFRPGVMFRGAVEVRGSHAKFGLTEQDVAGTWRALCDRARDFPGTTVISHEILAGATTDQIASALEPLSGLDVSVVVTARDLGRQATAHWQEEVKLGDTRSFADFEREQFRADTGRDAGPDSGGVRPHFWHAQDFADALRRWSSTLPAEQVHLVVCPAPGAPPDELWRRFAEAAGFDASLVDGSSPDRANPSLGVAEIQLLRRVNLALDGRLGPGDYQRVVKREYAEGELAAGTSSRPRTPAALREVFEPVTRAWLQEIESRGHPVHGDASELLPVFGADDDPHPDDVPAAERLDDDPVARADALVADTRDESTARGRGILARIRGRVRRPQVR